MTSTTTDRNDDQVDRSLVDGTYQEDGYNGADDTAVRRMNNQEGQALATAADLGTEILTAIQANYKSEK